MQNRLIIIKQCLLALGMLTASCGSNNTQATEPEAAYKMYVIEDESRFHKWGYIIECNNHLIIKQFSIPALDGEKPFTSKTQAEQVGALVTLKLNHSLRPSVSKKELDSLGIITSPADATQK